MRSIWKFGLNGGNTRIKEKVIKWLNAGSDPSGNICVWAIVDPEAGIDELEDRVTKLEEKGDTMQRKTKHRRIVIKL